MSEPSTGLRDPRAVVNAARAIVAALVLGVLVLMALSGLLPRAEGVEFLVVPAAIIGAVSPVIGYRAYHYLRERIPARASPQQRMRTFLRANILAMGITEGAALAGVIVHALTGSLLALLGAGMHVLLAGALWPSPEKLDAFVEGRQGVDRAG